MGESTTFYNFLKLKSPEDLIEIRENIEKIIDAKLNEKQYNIENQKLINIFWLIKAVLTFIINTKQ